MSRKSSANLKLALGGWVTELKLFRIQGGAESPQPVILHSCRTPATLVDRCRSCQYIMRVTEPQKTGIAKGKAATEPKDKVCTNCHHMLEAEQVTFCGTCDRVVENGELGDHLEFAGKTVPVSTEELSAWLELVPGGNEMRAVAIVLTSLIGSYLRDEAYQLVPDKGSTLSFAAWLQYLSQKRCCLIVHFHIAKNFKIGAIYVVQVHGTPTLILHTLYSYDQIELEPFDLPEVPNDVVDQVHELTEHLRLGAREPEISHPQRDAFHALFTAKQAGGATQLRKFGALPGEMQALSLQLGERLAPEKSKKEKKNKDKDALVTP